jgi:phage shock protein A
MGIFSRIKNGISSKANAALDKAIEPEKELDMAILELEDGRKKAMAELLSYKATAKLLEQDLEKHKGRAAEWERRAMVAVRAGDDEAARTALKEKKAAEAEAAKIERDKHEATGYAIQLNKSRKEFEVKLQMLKLRKGTLATQLASARSAGGDAFGNDASVWDRFKVAEDRIDQESIESEVDAAMRGDAAEEAMIDAKLQRASEAAGLSPGADPAAPEDALAKLKAKMVAEKAAKQKALAGGEKAAGAEKAAGGEPPAGEVDGKGEPKDRK